MLTLAPYFRVYDALLSTYGCNHTEAIVYSRLHARYAPGVQIRVVREREVYANNISRRSFDRAIMRLADIGLITCTEAKRDSRQFDYLISFVPEKMECFGRFTPVFYEATATYGLSPFEAYAFGLLATTSKGTIVRQSVSGIKARLGMSHGTDFVKTLRKFREAGIINCKWVNPDKRNLFDVITLPAYCCNSKKQAANNIDNICAEHSHNIVNICAEHAQKLTPQTPYNEIKKENKEKEINKEKDEVNDQMPQIINKEVIDAETAAARDRALATIERLMQQTKDPTGQKQRARAIREEIRHAPVVANASTINIRSGAAYQLTNNMQGGERQLTYGRERPYQLTINMQGGEEARGGLGPTTTGNAEADKILARAYRYGQRCAEEMLPIEKAQGRFETVRMFQEYGLDVLRVEFLRGYRNS